MMLKVRAFLILTLVLSSFHAAAALVPVPYFEQEKPNWCGVAVTQSVLAYYNISKNQSEIAEEYRFNSILKISKIKDYFKSKGFETAYFLGGDSSKSLERLGQYTDEGVPVIVLQRESVYSSKGHYRIALGFLDSKVVVLDPKSGILYIPEKDFMLLWKRNAETKYDNQMLVVKPIS